MDKKLIYFEEIKCKFDFYSPLFKSVELQNTIKSIDTFGTIKEHRKLLRLFHRLERNIDEFFDFLITFQHELDKQKLLQANENEKTDSEAI